MSNVKEKALLLSIIQEYSDFETKEYDLKDSQKLVKQINDLLLSAGAAPNPHIVGISEDNSELIFIYGVGTPIITPNVSLKMEGLENTPIATRLYLMCSYLAEVERCIGHMPIWYKYWVFRYLEHNSLNGLEQTNRITLDDVNDDLEVVCFEPAFMSNGNSAETKRYSNVVVKSRMVRTDDQDKTNENFGQIFAFCRVGNKYGYNQVMPYPYHRDRLDPKEDVELAFEVKDDILFS